MLGFPGCSEVKNLPANAGDTGSIPESERSPGVGNGNSLQYSVENSVDRGACGFSILLNFWLHQVFSAACRLFLVAEHGL